MKVILKLILNVKNVKTTNKKLERKMKKQKKYLLNIQKSFNDKTGLGFTANDPSTSKLRQIKFVKPSREI